ncbi:MAG: metallopeptidase family protein [Sphingomonadaceae bacterium]|nr:metallopeptidase family protein [Sphingomonadaceae bacterium]
MADRQSARWYGPDAGEIEALAMRAISALPAQFRAHLGNVAVIVRETPDAEMLASVDLDDPMELSGLYTGRPVSAKNIEESGALPDMIHLFRQPILAEAAQDGIPLATLVHHIVVHEIGHHFGLSDEDMHALEELAD